MGTTAERERISARVSIAVAETLNEAADLSGTTLSNFVVQAALKEAQRVIDREKTIYLTSNDAAMLLSLLDNPPPPNAALSRAFERFMKAKYGAESDSPGKGS
ncbi:type II toxin-antitoxin system TacA family antitoxin [Duganella hordei]|uniref:type II toxin-antitoxin system TacA family antitoxin n=1 Tax=Duganella hordei TaxID=2865934 RepID=UPI0030E8C7B1